MRKDKVKVRRFGKDVEDTDHTYDNPSFGKRPTQRKIS